MGHCLAALKTRMSTQMSWQPTVLRKQDWLGKYTQTHTHHHPKLNISLYMVSRRDPYTANGRYNRKIKYGMIAVKRDLMYVFQFLKRNILEV